MKNLWRILCLAVFITGILSFSQTPQKARDEVEAAAPYTVITAHYRINSDGSKITSGERIRYVKSNGEWRETRYIPEANGSLNDQANAKKDSALIASTEEGVFAKVPGHPERKFVSKAADQQMQDCFRSHKCLRNQLTFVRMDEVAGLKVYVLRYEMKDPLNSQEWIEQSYSPRTGYIPLRTVNHFRDGSEMVIEAKSVEFKDVPDNLDDDLREMPVKGKDK